MRKVVVPGELVSEKKVEGPVYEDDGKYYSLIYGLATYEGERVKLIPLEGRYMPKPGDLVIGVVQEARFFGYLVDIRSPYTGVLMANETREKFTEGDVISAKVKTVDEVKNVFLTSPRRLEGGRIIEIIPAKVPRVIGKKKSMVLMMKQLTGVQILVGSNGRVWLRGPWEKMSKVIEAILMIEREAHTTGLTDRIREFLEGEG